MAHESPQQEPPKKPTIDAIHKDLEFANEYRQEFIKILIGISGALFAFSVAFLPEVHEPIWRWLFWLSWFALAISMFGGFAQLACWERFYSSYQRFEWKERSGKAYRKRVTLVRRGALAAQAIGFAIGVLAMGSFTSLNLGSAKTIEKTNQVSVSK